MAACNGNGRELAKEHILNLPEIKTDKDMILFDHGYPSAGLMQYIGQAGFKYIMWCSTSFVASIKKKSPQTMVLLSINLRKMEKK